MSDGIQKDTLFPAQLKIIKGMIDDAIYTSEMKVLTSVSEESLLQTGRFFGHPGGFPQNDIASVCG